MKALLMEVAGSSLASPLSGPQVYGLLRHGYPEGLEAPIDWSSERTGVRKGLRQALCVL